MRTGRRRVSLWIGLASAFCVTAMADAPARIRRVQVDRVDVYSEPSDQSYIIARLFRGEPVRVRKSLPNGRLAITPPAGSFLWVDDEDVARKPDGTVEVDVVHTTLFFGREGETRPGPASRTVRRGSILQPLRKPLLTYGQGHGRRTWRAVGVAADDIGFINADALDDVRPPAPEPEVAERRTSLNLADPVDLPPDLIEPVRRIEANHRAITRLPIEGWDLSLVQRDYQALLAKQTDQNGKAALRERIERVAEHAKLADAAQRFESLVKASRRRDAEVVRARELIREIKSAQALSYDAEGLLQASARRVDGEKVYSLLNDDGQVVTFLRLPPGTPTSSLLAKRVGVRGKSRFNEGLRYRLLDVREIESLDRDD